MKLLYWLGEWHALAKLRMHRECTLNFLDNLTREFGGLIRHFRDTTHSAFTTAELPQESAARRRHQSTNQQTGVSPATSSHERRLKTLNLSTVKLHFMGDYVAHIRHFGTTDSYSTQLVRM